MAAATWHVGDVSAPSTADQADARPDVRAVWTVFAALVAVLVAVWLFRPAAPVPDIGAAVADSTLAAESGRVRVDGARELARADSSASATLALRVRNAELAVDIEHARARTDALLSQTARSVRALPPDSLASLADRTLRVRLGRE